MNGFYIGDIVGSSYAHEYSEYNKKSKNFDFFTNRSKITDDTILTFATIRWLMSDNHSSENMFKIIKDIYSKYPDTKPTMYGISFANWARAKVSTFRKSSGNGGAMRISPIAYYAKSTEELNKLVDSSVRPTHNTPQGILAAKIIAHSIFNLINGMSKKDLIKYIFNTFNLDLNINVKKYIKSYEFTSDGIETIKPALISFLISSSFEDAIRNAVAFGGDTDTITSITASLAEAYYKKIPQQLLLKAKSYLYDEFVLELENFNMFIKDKKINLI